MVRLTLPVNQVVVAVVIGVVSGVYIFRPLIQRKRLEYQQEKTSPQQPRRT